MPDAESPDAYFYERDKDARCFTRKPITDDRRLDGSTYIFQPDLLDRFREHPVQFIFNHGTLTGIVHFSDYSHDLVSTYLYAQIARYERGLRKLLEEAGWKNAHMLEFFTTARGMDKRSSDYNYYQKRIKSYNDHQAEFAGLTEFQSFYLKELLGLAAFRNTIDLSPIDTVIELRNQIMHAHDLVTMADARTPDFIYKPDSFQRFFTSVGQLLIDSRRIYSRQRILQELNQAAATAAAAAEAT